MHSYALMVALSIAPLAQLRAPTYPSAPYGSGSLNSSSGYTGDGIRGTVRANTTTRSVRPQSDLGRGSFGTPRTADGLRYDADSYPSDRQSGSGLSGSRLRDPLTRDPLSRDLLPSDARLGTSQFDRSRLDGYRTADSRNRDTLDRSRLEDDDRTLGGYTSQDRDVDRRELDRRDLDRRESDRPRSSTLDYDRRLPPVGDRDSRTGNTDSVKAADLLRMWIELPPDDDPRRVLSLHDAISRVNGTKEQIDVVKIYWGWVLAMAELRGMADEEAVLAEIARTVPPRTSYEKSLLRSSIEACRSRTAEAKRDVIARVVDLQEVSGNRSDQVQLPGNFPFVEAYDTQFERAFANRTPPANLRKIHNTLPEDLKVIRTRAVATDESVNLMAESAAAYFSRQIPLTEVLESVHDVRAQRRAFLEAVHHYNSTIAEYALTVAGTNVSKDGIVSMLIGTSGKYDVRQRTAYGSTYDSNLSGSYRSDPYTAQGSSRATYDRNSRSYNSYNLQSRDSLDRRPAVPRSTYEDERYHGQRDPYIR